MQQIASDIYAMSQYVVISKEGKIFISWQLAPELIARGADGSLLSDIGNQNPEDVLAAFINSAEEKLISSGIYASGLYWVYQKPDNTIYIVYQLTEHLVSLGADDSTLSDIGDQDPEEVIAAFFDTIPNQQDEGEEE